MRCVRASCAAYVRAVRCALFDSCLLGPRTPQACQVLLVHLVLQDPQASGLRPPGTVELRDNTPDLPFRSHYCVATLFRVFNMPVTGSANHPLMHARVHSL